MEKDTKDEDELISGIHQMGGASLYFTLQA